VVHITLPWSQTHPDDEPWVSIRDGTATEGNTGTTAMTFGVSLSAAYDLPVTVNYVTSDGSAGAGSDYQAVSGTVTFAPKEADETFYLDLFGNSGNSLFTKSRGVGTILNDD